MTRDLKFDIKIETRKIGGKIISNCYLNITVDDEDAKVLIDKFNFRRNNKFGGLFLVIRSTNFNNYIEGTDFNKAFNFLANTGKYTMPDFTIFKNIIKQAQSDTVTPEMKATQKDAVDRLYDDIINKINSPEIQKFLGEIGKVQVYDIDSSEIVGWRLSPDNAARACAVNPNATYVATRAQWLSWNRMLKGVRTPIVLYAKSHSNAPDHDAVKSELGINSFDVKDSIQQKNALDVLADIKGGSGVGYLSYVCFDVLDTEVIPGRQDLWNNQRGYENNLTGELNAAAKDGLIKTSETTPESNDANGMFAKKFINFLKKIKLESNIQKTISDILLNSTNDNAIYSALKTYFDFVYRRNPDAKVKNAEKEASIAVVLNSLNIAPNILKNILARYQDDVLKYLLDKKTLSMIVIDAMKVIEGVRHGLSEGQKVSTPQDVLILFDINPSLLDKSDVGDGIGTISEIFEKFNNLLDRMNNY